MVRDVEYWMNLKEVSTELVLVNSGKYVEHLIQKKQSLLLAGPFASIPQSELNEQVSNQHWLAAIRYHPHLIPNLEQIVQQKRNRFFEQQEFDVSDEYPIEVIVAGANPKLFQTKDLVPKILEECTENPCGILFIMQYVLHNPHELSKYQYVVSEVAKKCRYSNFWHTVYHIDLLCAWWFNKWIQITTEHEWQLLFDMIGQYSRFSQPKWTTTIAQLHNHFTQLQLHSLVKQTTAWLRRISLFQQVLSCHTDMLILCQ